MSNIEPKKNKRRGDDNSEELQPEKKKPRLDDRKRVIWKNSSVHLSEVIFLKILVKRVDHFLVEQLL